MLFKPTTVPEVDVLKGTFFRCMVLLWEYYNSLLFNKQIMDHILLTLTNLVTTFGLVEGIRMYTYTRRKQDNLQTLKLGIRFF